MNLQHMAEETVAIVERGSYQRDDGQIVNLNWRPQTTLYQPGEHPILPQPSNQSPSITIARETTLEGARRLGSACVLNFASAKNPGGGFLRGTTTQEESLAYVSTLYHSLKDLPHYTINRNCGTGAYTDYMAFSHDLIFRQPDGRFLDQPWPLTMITAAAPNRGAMIHNGESLVELTEILHRRAQQILRIAAAHKQINLVLGAWGCGVFQNDLDSVASAFREAIQLFGSYFTRIHFAVFDNQVVVDRMADALHLEIEDSQHTQHGDGNAN